MFSLTRVSTTNIRRWRLASGLAVVFVILGLATTASREFGVQAGRGWLVAVGDGVLQIGSYPGRFASGTTVRFYARDSWHSDWAMAWRPFHMSDSTPAGRGDLIVVPLWQVLAVTAGFFGWTVGYLAHASRTSALACGACGYDLSNTPVIDGARRCPECDAVRAAA